jgi:hypothetical protein
LRASEQFLEESVRDAVGVHLATLNLFDPVQVLNQHTIDQLRTAVQQSISQLATRPTRSTERGQVCGLLLMATNRCDQIGDPFATHRNGPNDLDLAGWSVRVGGYLAVTKL